MTSRIPYLENLPSLRPSILPLVSALCDSHNLFVLGAGASAEFIKPGDSLFRKVGALWLQSRGFPANGQTAPIVKHLVRAMKNHDLREIDAMLLGCLPPRGSEWIISYILSPPKKVQPYVSYEIFKRLQRPFAIVNYNHDSLARLSLKGLDIPILEPHGSVLPGLPDIAPAYEILEYAEYDIPVPWSGMVMFRPEPKDFSSSSYFHALNDIRRRVRNVFFIGYSFGASSDGKYDDGISREYFSDFVKGKQVFYVSPDSRLLSFVGELQEESKNKNINPVPLYWDKFSRAASELGMTFNRDNLKRNVSLVPVLLDRYQRLVGDSE